MPRKDIEPRRVADIKSILLDATADQLSAPLEKAPDGSYLITPALLAAYGLEFTPEGTLRTKQKEDIKHTSESGTNLAKVSLGPGEGEIWEILTAMASMKADATVADRVMTMRCKPGLEDTTLTSLLHIWDSNDPTAGDAVTCSAAQYGILWYTFGGSSLKGFSVESDNGTLSAITSIPQRLFLRGAALNTGTLSVAITNKGATDVTMISCLYKVVGTGQ